MRDGYKQENSSLLVTTHYVVVVVHNILFSMDRDIFFLFYFLFFFIYLLCELVEYDGQASRHQGCVPFVYPVIPICAIWNCLRDQPTDRAFLFVGFFIPADKINANIANGNQEEENGDILYMYKKKKEMHQSVELDPTLMMDPVYVSTYSLPLFRDELSVVPRPMERFGWRSLSSLRCLSLL